jgi:site-specific DNA recombinase
MVSTFVSKASKRYRYYMTSPAHLRKKPPMRVPAFDLEQLVIDRIDAWLMEVETFSHDVTLSEASARLKYAEDRRAILCGVDKFASFKLFRELVSQVCLGAEDLTVDVALCGSSSNGDFKVSSTLTSKVAKVRVGKETKLIVGIGDEAPARHDPKLINAVVTAYRARKLLESGRSIPEIGGELKVSIIQASRLVRLGYFAPQITSAILSGQQPLGLSKSMLTLAVDMPLDWGAQCKTLNVI